MALRCGNGRIRASVLGCAPEQTSKARSLASPNIIAYLMLCVWPVVAWTLWTRLDPARALIWTILGGYLILPPIAALSLPVVPDLDKFSIPSLTALLFALMLRRDKIGFDPGTTPGRILIAMFVLSPFATVLTNGEPIEIEAGDIQGLRIYDSVAAVANQAIAILPFFLARRYLASAQAMRAVLVALVAAGFAYSGPMLVEVVMSPQINVWVYGFFQHDFGQTMRGGGFRPVVFLPHGLWVAFFAVMCVAAALTQLRAAPADQRPKYTVAVVYLALLLVICKSAGPMLYGLALAPMILLVGRRAQVMIAAVLAVIVMAYPLLRGAHLVPVDQIVDFARSLNPERAHSLAFRIDNEERLLARAAEKPWFGWGGYARGLIHDPVTGRVLTIGDGAWIITLGMRGWMGYIAEFGLLLLPLLMLAREAWGRAGRSLSPYVAAVALVLAVNAVDLLPNATLIPFTWLLAGAVFGAAEQLRSARVRDLRAAVTIRKPLRTVI